MNETIVKGRDAGEERGTVRGAVQDWCIVCRVVGSGSESSACRGSIDRC